MSERDVPDVRRRKGDAELGGKLRAARVFDDLTLKEVAAGVEGSPSSIQAYETGQTPLPLRVLVRLCLLYGTPLDLIRGRRGKLWPFAPAPKPTVA